MIFSITRPLAITAFLFPAAALQAHHSAVMFEKEREITLEGVVKEFQYTNPHSWLLVDVTNEGRYGDNLGIRGRGPEHAAARRDQQGRLHPGNEADHHRQADARRQACRVVVLRSP